MNAWIEHPSVELKTKRILSEAAEQVVFRANSNAIALWLKSKFNSRKEVQAKHNDRIIGLSFIVWSVKVWEWNHTNKRDCRYIVGELVLFDFIVWQAVDIDYKLRNW